MKHVYLVGFPGTGTVTIGKQLAERLKLPFRDLDARMEEAHATGLMALFGQMGREAFGQAASATLQTLAAEAPSVVAVADHVPLSEQDWALIKESGHSVYIQRPAERLYWRLHHDRKLPIFYGIAPEAREGFIAAQLAEREGRYTQADLVVSCYHEEVPDIAKLIVEKLAA